MAVPNVSSTEDYKTTPNSTVAMNDMCSSVDMSVLNICYTLFMMFLFVLSVSGNVLVVLVVAMSHSLRRRSTFYFVASLGKLTNFRIIQMHLFQLILHAVDNIIMLKFLAYLFIFLGSGCMISLIVQ